jgi:TolB-like protein/class 3 adenylate cyclase/tetratricopeptide (TPR) repeat protein
MERRLAAIFAADVAGYSRLMEQDEIGTLRTLTAHRKVMDHLIAEHGGRIANTAGDSVLAEFPSVVDAVQCAVAVQEKLWEASASLGDEPRLQFRIGVHVGDVMIKGGDLLGGGVNITARIQALAQPGGICISGDAHAHVRKAIPLTFTDCGQQHLKNINEPVRVYAIAAPGVADRLTQGVIPRIALPDKPSIAVLPFTNMSTASEQEYFADGIVEDIITALSHFPRLFVIARNSTFTYKGRAIDIRAVGRELGVRYVLEGSIRTAGGRLRITGQLIDAETGVHLWADRFEGVLEEVFEFQDEVTRNVVGAIMPSVTAAEIERTQRKRPESLDAYDLYLRALPAIREMTLAGNNQALALVHQALKINPRYSVMAGLGAWIYTLRIAQGWCTNPEAERSQALDLARQAIANGQNDADALSMAGYTLGFLGERLREGLAAVDRAINLNPNSALSYANAGWLKAYLGRADQAIADFERSIRLSPRDPSLFRAEAGLCFAFLLEGNLERSIDTGRSALFSNPNFTPTHRALASTLGHAGKLDEAKQVVDALLQLVPGLTVSSFAQQTLFRYSGKLEVILEGLRRAGLPP